MTFPIPFQSLEEMAKKKYDVLVIGTGAGGGAVLCRLCERWGDSQKTIGVIEAGDLLLSTHAYNIPELKAGAKWKNYFDNIAHSIGRHPPHFLGTKQVYALGGKTLFWGAVAPRMRESEFIKWPLSYKEITPYYEFAEDMMQIHKSSKETSLQLQDILQHLHSNGFREARSMPRAGSHRQTFSSLCFLEKAWEHRPFDLSIKARAIQVLMKNEKPVGVKVADHNKKSFVLKAKIIVLAVGSLETPRLLLHSRIRGNTIGHYLTFHSYIRARGVFINNPFGNILSNVSILILQTHNSPYQFQLFISKESINVVGFGKVESIFENKLRLDPQNVDEFGVPNIKIDFSYSDKDLEILRQMKVTLNQVVNALGGKLAHTQGKSKIRVMALGSDYHESGTCRIGNDPSRSATNRFGQIHGIPGLYVADNSILPTIGATNPTLTTVALAIRIADHISNPQ